MCAWIRRSLTKCVRGSEFSSLFAVGLRQPATRQELFVCLWRMGTSTWATISSAQPCHMQTKRVLWAPTPADSVEGVAVRHLRLQRFRLELLGGSAASNFPVGVPGYAGAYAPMFPQACNRAPVGLLEHAEAVEAFELCRTAHLTDVPLPICGLECANAVTIDLAEELFADPLLDVHDDRAQMRRPLRLAARVKE